MFPEGFIDPQRILCGVEISSKKRSLEMLGGLFAATDSELSQDMVFDALLQRERLGSTGLGRGIALPHARMAQIKRAVGAFIQTTQGVDFDAIDNQPVDLAFAMLVPEEATEEHLQLLSKLASLFGDKAFCDRLRQCRSPAEVIELIQQTSPEPSQQ
ncbi:PTS IIA-like nitrogen regulatory protein PtsN [endosymbiont of Ridgeia piscesae]|jgi:PTS system nitrogen regulatory IIA component|uniref:PTS IIA-like nitrogen-regulatory protein PtsN n=1 Tax=endosymbiont of Ridgeia piscesae TaxID=54398 RepID=A0A0T5YSY1_9GAMM|nr:PTS IIA-like nitrogen regulatory protein PtsN [endosymbiont of Ridgeia piscesae]KRT53727.1 PTS IIA-like nitrogen-regulatory protein PtsN [endosymbiont of Ridgeia piscesae]KRT58106.1 PTS IIA-like nitrogen-regulatory protein PtsN [endosymbiont of Ridgeia piscesae]